MKNKFIEYLKEEWEASIKMSKAEGYASTHVYDIYKNPTSSDYVKLKKDNSGRIGVRALAYPQTQSVYVFTDSILHYMVIRKLGLKKMVLAITGYIKNNKIWCQRLDLYGDDTDNIPNKDERKFMEKYFLNLEQWDHIL